MAEIQWAVVRNNNIIYGPGPLPYFWTDPDTGDAHEMRALNLSQKTALGWQKVEVRGKRPSRTDVRVEVAPTVTIIRGRVVEQKNYDFVPKARTTLSDEIDERAERARSVFAQSRPLQTMVYKAKSEEVDRLLNDPNPVDENYPFLAASLGIEGSTIQEVATVVAAARDQWIAAAAIIERKRLMAKKLLKEAISDDEALTITDGTTL